MRNVLRALAFTALLPLAASATTYNPTVTFTSNSANPDGPFSYASGTVANPIAMNGFGSNFAGAYGPYRSNTATNAVIIYNANGIHQGSVYFPAPAMGNSNELLLHPGNQNDDAILIFTAPFSGNFNEVGSFTRRDTNQGHGNGVTASVYASTSPSAIESQSLPSNTVPLAYGESYSFNDTQYLSAGQKLYFGVNDNGVYDSDSTGLALSISGTPATPEPSSLVLLGTGVMSVAGFARRKFLRS